MTPSEQIRAFIERLKGEHSRWHAWGREVCGNGPSCDALRAVLALEEITTHIREHGFCREAGEHSQCSACIAALARAAQKIGGKK